MPGITSEFVNRRFRDEVIKMGFSRRKGEKWSLIKKINDNTSVKMMFLARKFGRKTIIDGVMSISNHQLDEIWCKYPESGRNPSLGFINLPYEYMSREIWFDQDAELADVERLIMHTVQCVPTVGLEIMKKYDSLEKVWETLKNEVKQISSSDLIILNHETKFRIAEDLIEGRKHKLPSGELV